MKKILLIILLVIITVTTYSQRIPAYKATNGKIYYEDDTITLNRGSMPDGSFKYLQMGDFYNSMAAMNGDYNKVGSSIGRNYSGLNVIIKKIKVVKLKGAKKVYFVVGGGNITNYKLWIDDAIATCEVTDCDEQKYEQTIIMDKYDKLKKLKEVFDAGILTEEEYRTEKAKLLELKK